MFANRDARVMLEQQRYTRLKGRDFSPTINRWTGEPHEHSRERARNGWFRCKKGTGPFTLGGKTPRVSKAK
jgi:hypothetical protein